MILHLSAPIPSKKNSRLVVVGRGMGRALNIPSEAYRRWHAQNLRAVLAQAAGEKVERCALTLHVGFADRRRRDLDNALSSVLDLLVDAGVLPDDCWAVVPHIQLEAYESDEPEAVVSLLPI
jgi:Holliday junction resolvase RusA-like endonuclease